MATVWEWLDALKAELGVTEDPPFSNCQPYSHELGRPCEKWCMDLPACIAHRIGLVLPSDVPWVPTVADAFRQVGWFGTEPQIGAFVFWDFDGDHILDHVSVCESWTEHDITTIDGNTYPQNGSGSDSDGGGVYRRTRPRASVCGFGYPIFEETPMLTGPDVSNLQGDVDMHAVHAAGHSFVGIKVSEGGDYLDSCFKRNRDRARAEGLVRLLYHFTHPANGRGFPIGDPRSAVLEARWFLRCIGQLEPGEIAVCDLEDSKVLAGVDLTAWLLAFLAEVDQATGRAGGPTTDDAELYSYAPYITAHLRLRPGGKQLWLAAYTDHPTVPAPWNSWTFHQYTSSGSCPGINGRCDLNRFTGPIDALHRIAGLAPQEDDMAIKTIDIKIDSATGAGWETTGMPLDKLGPVSPVSFQGAWFKTWVDEHPAIDGEGVVHADLGGPQLAPDIKVHVKIAHTA